MRGLDPRIHLLSRLFRWIAGSSGRLRPSIAREDGRTRPLGRAMPGNDDTPDLMFTLAHLSDPHLGPIPTPRLAEIMNKRGLGLINWYRKRHRRHSRAVLDV